MKNVKRELYAFKMTDGETRYYIGRDYGTHVAIGELYSEDAKAEGVRCVFDKCCLNTGKPSSIENEIAYMKANCFMGVQVAMSVLVDSCVMGY